jgi:tRNA nucleotidyltransferase (CCA-adding enzyme)
LRKNSSIIRNQKIKIINQIKKLKNHYKINISIIKNKNNKKRTIKKNQYKLEINTMAQNKNKTISKGKSIKRSPMLKKKDIEKIINQVKLETQPDEKDLIGLEKFIKLLNKTLRDEKIDADASIGGSVAKGTHIKDNFDADIFVKFSIKFKGKNISDILEKILLKMKLKFSRVHGSRDYFQIKNSFTYELVPVLDVKDYREAENVADMSPLHVHYFLKQFAKNKKLKDEIRITKVFMKASRVYGAESYIKGFSGHVVDLLLVKHKTFLDLIESAAKWKDEVIIDIEKYHIDPKMSLNTSKIAGPLILVDPIQKNRNAAAALSKECFDNFKYCCREFLKKPSKEFFIKPDFNEVVDQKVAQLKNNTFFIMNIVPLEGKRDVVGSKVLKIKEHLEAKAKEYDFKLSWSDWEFNENMSRICFAFDDKPLATEKNIQGPPIAMSEAVRLFQKAHKITFEEKGIIYAKEKRTYTKPIDFLQAEISSSYVKEKCKSINFVVNKSQ